MSLKSRKSKELLDFQALPEALNLLEHESCGDRPLSASISSVSRARMVPGTQKVLNTYPVLPV